MSTVITLQLSAADAAGLALLIARLDEEELLLAMSAHESEVMPLIESLSALSTQLTLQGINPHALERHETLAHRAVRHYLEALRQVSTQDPAVAREAAAGLLHWAEQQTKGPKL